MEDPDFREFSRPAELNAQSSSQSTEQKDRSPYTSGLIHTAGMNDAVGPISSEEHRIYKRGVLGSDRHHRTLMRV